MTALEQAAYYWERREYLDDQARLDAAIALSEWPVFSSRHVAAILDLNWWQAAWRSGKKDRTGGRFNPDDLPALKRLAVARARGEVTAAAAADAVAGGTSTLMASRLSGVPESSLKRYIKRAKEES